MRAAAGGRGVEPHVCLIMAGVPSGNQVGVISSWAPICEMAACWMAIGNIRFES